MSRAANIYRLGIKELWSLARDPVMLVLIAFTFTVMIYVAATAMPEQLHHAPIGIVDEDKSQLSSRIISAFHPPRFIPTTDLDIAQMDTELDAGHQTFVINIPPDFQRDMLAGRAPAIQLNVDATRMSQAFTGSGYIQQIIQTEVMEFMQRHRVVQTAPVTLALRNRFNPNLTPSWFGALNELINLITMLSIILTGAALIREREHGTVEHLLVMPVTPGEIMFAKIWSMVLVVVCASFISLKFVIQGALEVPVQGSHALFFVGVVLHLFATASMGIYMATVARSMPRFGLLMIMTLIPLEMLSGGITPSESMPEIVQHLMQAAPTTHFVSLSKAILFRGAGIEVVWQSLMALLLIGIVLYILALGRFRKTINTME
ncbi:ABC transporter permease [Prosthecobacter dejongeii]|uniref:ABC-2 type transport system permease protein n=1 Tax=Prosthecobacter dejongeii TaxID=48465 RepID=A0A7W7YQX3_9BACT|nr:ABC transporter permease [Prosthecobacter dejongeii]MBB5040567.1 ABC-2 type transport system permease protein [Prosthecobacter dejongeii]